MKLLMASVLAVATLSAQPRPQTFTGVIFDARCAIESHASMRMAPTDADCAVACVQAHDDRYVLVVGSNIYELSDQRTPEKLAAQTVKVTGTLDAKTRMIHVAAMTAAR